MHTGKRVLAAILGGLAMFIWGAVSHMALPLYNGSLQKFTDQDAVLQVISANAQKSGTYFLPNIPDLAATASNEEKEAAEKAMMEKSEHGPSMFAFVRVGELGSWTPLLIVEYVSNALAVLVLAWLLLKTGVTKFGDRVTAAVCVGVLVILSETVSQANWYSAGMGFTIAETVDQVVGWFAAGLVMAKILPKAQMQI